MGIPSGEIAVITKGGDMKLAKKLAPVAIGIAYACVCALALVGCGQPTPSDVVKSSFEAIQSQDSAAFAQTYAGDISADGAEASGLFGTFKLGSSDSDTEVSDADKEHAENIAGKIADFDYAIGEESINGDTATVKVTFTTYDFPTAFTEALKEALSNALAMSLSGDKDKAKITSQLYENLDTAFSKLEEKSTTGEAELSLTKTDGAWKLDELSEDAVDALMGGLISKTKELNSSMSGSSSQQ